MPSLHRELPDKTSNELCLGIFFVLNPYCSRLRNFISVCEYNYSQICND